jgi:hypothetical protein
MRRGSATSLPDAATRISAASAISPKPMALTGPSATARTPETTMTANTTPEIRSMVSSMGSSTLRGCAVPETTKAPPTSISCAVDRKALSVRSETYVAALVAATSSA